MPVRLRSESKEETGVSGSASASQAARGTLVSVKLPWSPRKGTSTFPNQDAESRPVSGDAHTASVFVLEVVVLIDCLVVFYIV